MDRSKEYGYAIMRNMRVQRRFENQWVGGVWKDDVKQSRIAMLVWPIVMAVCLALMYL